MMDKAGVFLRPAARAVPRYVPGKPIEELQRELGLREIAKLASNENPLGPSPEASVAAKKAFEGVHRYPDGGVFELRRDLAAFLKVPEANLVFGNGSNEILVNLALMLLDENAAAVFAEPSFVVYPQAVTLSGARGVAVPLRDGFLDLDAMARAAEDPSVRVVFCCNPNNPTGTHHPLKEIDNFLKNLRKETLLVLDEAYVEYVGREEDRQAVAWASGKENVAVVRTFSKVYGLAGLRVGYAVVPESIAQVYENVRQPFNVNSIAQVAARAALRDQEHVRRVVEMNREQRMRLEKVFRELGLSYYPSQANFVWVDVPRAREVYKELLHRGVIVRPMGDGAIRVTTGTPEETEKFLTAFREIVGRKAAER